MRVKSSKLYKKQVKEIVNYIAQDKPKAAKKWTQNLKKTVDRLREFPKSGRIVPEYELENYREIIYGNYRVLYQIIPEKEVVITSIWHGRRNLPEKDLLDAISLN